MCLTGRNSKKAERPCTRAFFLASSEYSPYASVCWKCPPKLLNVGTWLSLVEHSLGVRGVGSSNLPVPTNLRSGPSTPHPLRSGFRQRARTPVKRLVLGGEGSEVQICPSRPIFVRVLRLRIRCAQDFASGLGRPLNGSTWGARGRQFKSARPDQFRSGPSTPHPLRSGFRQRARTPAKRLNLGWERSAFQICPSRPTKFSIPKVMRSRFPPLQRTQALSRVGPNEKDKRCGTR